MNIIYRPRNRYVNVYSGGSHFWGLVAKQCTTFVEFFTDCIGNVFVLVLSGRAIQGGGHLKR